MPSPKKGEAAKKGPKNTKGEKAPVKTEKEAAADAGKKGGGSETKK